MPVIVIVVVLVLVVVVLVVAADAVGVGAAAVEPGAVGGRAPAVLAVLAAAVVESRDAAPAGSCVVGDDAA